MSLWQPMIFALFAIVAISWASHWPTDYDPRWISAASDVASLIILFYAMTYLKEISDWLGFLVGLMSGDKEAKPGIQGTLQALVHQVRKESDEDHNT